LGSRVSLTATRPLALRCSGCNLLSGSHTSAASSRSLPLHFVSGVYSCLRCSSSSMATTSTSVSHDFRLNQLSYARCHSATAATSALWRPATCASAATQRHATCAFWQHLSGMRHPPSGSALATCDLRRPASSSRQASFACGAVSSSATALHAISSNSDLFFGLVQFQ
jgi:hypothetical protein